MNHSNKHMTNIQTFQRLYTIELGKAVNTNPNKYRWFDAGDPSGSLCNFSARMTIDLSEGNANKDTDTIKAVCKQLKIKHTYKAIEAYLNSTTPD